MPTKCTQRQIIYSRQFSKVLEQIWPISNLVSILIKRIPCNAFEIETNHYQKVFKTERKYCDSHLKGEEEH